MKLGMFYNANENRYIKGIIENNKVIEISDYNNLNQTNRIYFLEDLIIKYPVFPTKIVGVGLNYKKHAKELNMDLPKEPIIFIKPNTSVLSPKENIILPQMSQRVDYEAEVAVVIKKKAKNIKKEEVKDYILGYTAFNDVTARDLQKLDGQWTRSKSFDTFSPFGPFIETNIENLNNLRIQAILNNEIKQDSNTSDMIFDIETLVSFISQVMTLNEGDVIATGTPEGIGPLKKGDEIIIRIEGLNDLINYVD